MSDSKASKLRPPSKIGRPCCTVPPKPALPTSPPRSTMNSMEPLWEGHGRRLSEAGLRRGSDTSVVLTEDTDSFIIGERVWVGGSKPGSIAYIGETQFAPGDWAGVVLDEPIGKNDGSVAGSRYFQCEPKRGIFSRLTRLTRHPLPEAMIVSPTGEKTPTSPLDSSRGNLNKSVSPSLNASTSSLVSVSNKDLRLGDRVIVSSSQGSKTGVLRFMGATEFAAGEWCGVELDDAVGKNDGSVGDTRYFECRPKHGLFAPFHKVSRSPSSRKTNAMCAIHKPTGASINSSIRRLAGSRESLASMSSLASTNTSVATRGTPMGSRRPGLRTLTPAPRSMQEVLKEKQQEIDMLRKERDFERQRISKAATQADNAEQTVLTLKQEYDKYRVDMEQTVREAQIALTQLLEEKNTLKAHLEEEKQKSEDLLFRFEEESVNKDDIKNHSTDQCVVNTLNEGKLKELEKQLSEERERVIQLEQENIKLFEAEEEIAKLRTELSSALDVEQKNFQDIENRNLCLEEAKITLEKQMLERNDLIEEYSERIKDFEDKLKERDHAETAARKELEHNLQRCSDEMMEKLAKKNELIEEMKRGHEVGSETLKKEIEQLKQMIENIVNESTKEKEMLTEEYRRMIVEKENEIKKQTEQLEAETMRYSQIHKSALEKLRADSVEQINQLSEKFKEQLATKDLQINSIFQQLEEKSMEIERLVKELSIQRSACLSKDEELKTLLQRVQELGAQLRASEEENSELKKQMDNLRSQSDETYTSFNQEKQKFEASIANLIASSTDSSAQLEKLNEYLKTKEQELSELRDAKAAEIEQLKKDFESQIEDKTKYITEMNADMSKQSSRLSALQKEIANLKLIIANKDEEIKNLLEKTSELDDAITLSEQTKTNLESELRMYDINIAELNKKLSRAEEKSIQLTEQKSKLEVEIANVISTSTNSTDQLVKYNEDLRDKEKELDDLRDHSFQIENSLAVAESKISNILEELTKSNELAKVYRAESDELKNTIITEVKSNEELTSQVEELKTKERTLIKTIKDNEKLYEELKIKNTEVTVLTDKLEKSNENFVALKEKYSSLEKEASDNEKRFENMSVDLKNEIMGVREECRKSQEMCEKLEMERVELNKSVNLLTKNVDTETDRIKKLEASIVDKNAQMERLEDKIGEIKRERDKATEAANFASEKYNESLMQLALLNSTRASTETENSLELSNLREQLLRAESSNKELTDRLKNDVNDVKKLEDKLNEFAEMLKMSEMEKIKLSAGLKQAENSVKEFQTLLHSRNKEFDEKLQESVNEKFELTKQIELLKVQLSGMKNELAEKNKAVEEIHVTCESLKGKLEELETSNRADDIEAQSAAALANDVQMENKILQKTIDALNADVISKENRVKEMENEVDTLREFQANMAKDEWESVSTKLEAKQTKIDELAKQNECLRLGTESVEKSLATEKEKIALLEVELSLTKKEATQLKENQNRLEKENKQIVEKLNEALVDLKTSNENHKNNQEIENYPSNLKIESAIGTINQNSDRHNELKKLVDENETYRGQIDFLNSVIVDMQRKNETLVCKIEVLEMGVPANEADDYSRSTLDKRMAAPRMFCDICDRFDLHETEDCPRQAQDFAEAETPSKSQKKVTVDRPYCDNCEVFGHDTLDCDDAETF